jgi:hypothetical protein
MHDSQAVGVLLTALAVKYGAQTYPSVSVTQVNEAMRWAGLGDYVHARAGENDTKIFFDYPALGSSGAAVGSILNVLISKHLEDQVLELKKQMDALQPASGAATA